MNISKLALIALLGGALMAFGCGDDGGGTGGTGGSGGTGGTAGGGGEGGQGGTGGMPSVDAGQYTFTCTLSGLPIPLPVVISILAEDPGFAEGTATSLTSQLAYSVAPAVIGLLPDLAPDAMVDSVDASVGVAGGMPTSITFDATAAPNTLPFSPVAEFDSTEEMNDITPDAGASEIALSVDAFSTVITGLPENFGGTITLEAGVTEGCTELAPVEGSGPLTFSVAAAQ